MDKDAMMMRLSEIEEANADIYRLSVILRLCGWGMINLSDTQKQGWPFTHDCIGDALDVLGKALEATHEAIDTAREEIRAMK